MINLISLIFIIEINSISPIILINFINSYFHTIIHLYKNNIKMAKADLKMKILAEIISNDNFQKNRILIKHKLFNLESKNSTCFPPNLKFSFFDLL